VAGRPVDDLAPLVHSGIVIVLPGFAGRIRGREEFLAGFRHFRESSNIQEFHEHDLQCDATGDTAVITFRYEMVYERTGNRYRATGRDLWVFQNQHAGWIAVWRAMLEMEENAV